MNTDKLTVPSSSGDGSKQNVYSAESILKITYCACSFQKDRVTTSTAATIHSNPALCPHREFLGLILSSQQRAVIPLRSYERRRGLVFLTKTYRLSFLKVETEILRYWRKIQAYLKSTSSEGRAGIALEHSRKSALYQTSMEQWTEKCFQSVSDSSSLPLTIGLQISTK